MPTTPSKQKKIQKTIQKTGRRNKYVIHVGTYLPDQVGLWVQERIHPKPHPISSHPPPFLHSQAKKSHIDHVDSLPVQRASNPPSSPISICPMTTRSGTGAQKVKIRNPSLHTLPNVQSASKLATLDFAALGASWPQIIEVKRFPMGIFNVNNNEGLWSYDHKLRDDCVDHTQRPRWPKVPLSSVSLLWWNYQNPYSNRPWQTSPFLAESSQDFPNNCQLRSSHLASLKRWRYIEHTIGFLWAIAANANMRPVKHRSSNSHGRVGYDYLVLRSRWDTIWPLPLILNRTSATRCTSKQKAWAPVVGERPDLSSCCGNFQKDLRT